MAKSRQQIARELGISTSTLWRRLRESGLVVPSGLIYPHTEATIKALFGEHTALQVNDDKKDDRSENKRE